MGDDAIEQYKMYKQQLTQVEELLKVNPTDSKSLGVKAKLVDVIDLYGQLLGAEVVQQINASLSSSQPPDPSPSLSFSLSGNATSSDSTPSISTSSSSTKWHSGSVCEFLSPEGQLFPVRIVETKEEEQNKFIVHFYGFGRQQEVLGDQLRSVTPMEKEYLAPSAVQVGLSCQAKYFEDGQWYDGKVSKLIEDGTGVHVHFTLYGNTEEVPMEWLRIKRIVKVAKSMSEKKSGSSSSSSRGGGGGGGGGESSYVPSKPKILAIPDKLKAKEGDTDKERANKRKRMRTIQNKNRFAKKEIESNEKQASWQTFQKRATKKLKKGVSSTSQFSTIKSNKR